MKGIIKAIIGGCITLAILGLCYIGWVNHVQSVQQLSDAVSEVLPKSTNNDIGNTSNILDSARQTVESDQESSGVHSS